MALGDDATAAGMDVTEDATTLASILGSEITKTRDYIAQFFTAAKAYADTKFAAVSLTWSAITGKPSTFPPSSHSHSMSDVTGLESEQAGQWNEIDNAKRGLLWADIYNRNITWTRRTVWVGDNGHLGYASSSRRHKQDIAPFDITDAQVEALQVVSYRYIAQVAAKGNDAATEVGLLAEDLEEAGLGWALFYDDEGRPEGINYELIALALIPYVHRLSARVTALENEG